MNSTENQILFLMCDDQLDLVLRSDCPRTFVHHAHYFEDLADRDFNGFYDFLRDSSRHVLGVSFLASALPEFLLDRVRPLPYVELVNSTSLRIFFTEERSFDPSISMDQYFGENRIYRSAAGGVALSFSLALLASSEIRSIPARVAQT
jgi:hypothetical protein